MYKRQIYQIAESNRIESKLFSPELECSTALSCGVVCVILIASRGKKRVHSVVNICYKYTQQVEAARMVGDTTTCSRQNHHRPVGLCVCVCRIFREKLAVRSDAKESRASRFIIEPSSSRLLFVVICQSINQSSSSPTRSISSEKLARIHSSRPTVTQSVTGHLPSQDICPSLPPSPENYHRGHLPPC